jgi:UDP-N-acetylmuramyl pentapeptide phosphotransferase/UDP-N-acetylglucosamine-1-phosphate transferase
MAVAGSALAIAWAANLDNFMDGSDGLAGATTLIGFGALAVAARGDVALRTAALAIAAASVPFLAANRPPARLFLGDVGAVPAGYLAAVLAIGGCIRGEWPAWFPLLVFLPFVADASLTLAARIARRERWWEGHRVHYYQRLAQLGAGHHGTLRVYALLIAGSTGTAVACRLLAPRAGWLALASWLTLVLIVFTRIDYHWRKKTNMG